MEDKVLPTHYRIQSMLNNQTHASNLRNDLLDCVEFCESCSESMIYRPAGYRPSNEMINTLSRHLHTVMGYRADQPEI